MALFHLVSLGLNTSPPSPSFALLLQCRPASAVDAADEVQQSGGLRDFGAQDRINIRIPQTLVSGIPLVWGP